MKTLAANFFKLPAVVLMLSIVFAPPVSAAEMFGGDNIFIDKQLLDDTYIVGGNVNVESEVNGDLYVVGGQILVNGDVMEDLVVLGGRVTVTGNVAGDVRVGGGQVLLLGNVGDDVLVGAGQVDIGKSSNVGGSVIAGAGILTVDGDVAGDMRGTIGLLILHGKIGGDVIVTVEDKLDISGSALIGGNLHYSAILEGNVPDGVVQGEIKFNVFDRENLVEGLTYILLIQKFFSYLAALLLAFVLVLIMPRGLMSAAALTKSDVLKSFGMGLLTTVGAFIGVILLMVTVIGIPVAMVLLASLVIVFYFAKIFVAAWITGYVISPRKKLSRIKLFFMLALALVAYYLVGMVPYVGFLLHLVLFLIGVGSMVLLEIDALKFLRTKKVL